MAEKSMTNKEKFEDMFGIKIDKAPSKLCHSLCIKCPPNCVSKKDPDVKDCSKCKCNKFWDSKFVGAF